MNNGRVLSVGHTGITVSDMARAIRFFGDALGGTITAPVRHDDPVFERITGMEGAQITIAYVDLPGHKLELLEYARPLDRRGSTARPCDPGHLHIMLLVEGIDDLLRTLAGHGFKPVGPVQHVDEAGGFKVIYTYGFDGIVVELMDFS